MNVTAPVSRTPSPEVRAAIRPQRRRRPDLPNCPRCGCKVPETDVGLWVALGEDCCSMGCARKWGHNA